MTTPFEAWQTEAMRLADKYASAESDLEWEPDQGWTAERIAKCKKDRDDARAALSAHLLAVPMGEPVAWVRQHDGAQTSAAQRVHATEDDANDVARMYRDDGYQCLVLPLFTKPEGMA